jgi:hypothetical protein
MTAWDTQLASERAREAYRYVARVYPKGAPWGPIGKIDAQVVEAEQRSDWEAYEEGLREMCRVARAEAIRRRRAA